MKLQFHSVPLTLPLLICSGLCQATNARPSDAPALEHRPMLTAKEVIDNLVRRNLERAQAMGAYQATRVYRLEYHGFLGSRRAEMAVDVKYQSPGTKEFTIRSEIGSKLLIEKVFRKLLWSEKEALTEENKRFSALNNDNYLFTLLDHESKVGDSLYVLSVEPRTKKNFLYRGRIWVDVQDFAVVRVEGEPVKTPSFWMKDTKVEQVYAKVGNFWLPASNHSTTTIRLGGTPI